MTADSRHKNNQLSASDDIYLSTLPSNMNHSPRMPRYLFKLIAFISRDLRTVQTAEELGHVIIRVQQQFSYSVLPLFLLIYFVSLFRSFSSAFHRSL